MYTEKEIQSHHLLMSSLKLEDHNINLYLLWAGGEYVAYALFERGNLVFYGEDFRPSPLYGYDSIDTILYCLGFLVLKEGDTDKEYFSRYTDKQLAFSRQYKCEVISGLISDYENQDDNAKNYFTNRFEIY